MQKLFMLILGATPTGRHIEQHDIFFGIANEVKDLVPDIVAYWPEVAGRVHVDAWREVSFVNGYAINIVSKNDMIMENKQQELKLFFINLGGYKEGEFEEYHYKLLVACHDKSEAIKQAKQTAFYKHTGFKGATSHVDDKYGVDVDDLYEINDILPQHLKEKYAVDVKPTTDSKEDELHIGYYKLTKLMGL